MPHPPSASTERNLIRFKSYSNFTRRFSGAPRREHLHLSDDAFASLMSYLNFDSGRMSLFPNLVELDAIASEVIHLGAPSVTSLVVTFAQDVENSPTIVDRVALAVPLSMPSLESIVVEGGTFVVEQDSSFAHLFSCLPHLYTVSLPRYTATPAIYSALAHNQSVRALWTNDGDEYSEESFSGHRDSVLRWTSSAISHLPAFDRLRCLSLALNHVSDWIAFFTHTSFPWSLLHDLEIFIARPRTVTADDLISLLAKVRDACPRLEDLSLSMYAHTIMAQDFDGITPIGLSVILAVAELPCVRNLRIEHSLPLKLSDADIAILAPVVEDFETLSLNPHPLGLCAPSLTMASVAHFARHCPDLDFLGLYIDGRKFPFIADPEDMPSFSISTGFVLDLGLSPAVPDAGAEALYVYAKHFALMLPPMSEIQTGYREVMHDSREFLAVDDAPFGMVRVSDNLLAEYSRFWDAASGLGNYFRPHLQRIYG